MQPGLDELGPGGDGEFGAAESEGVSAVGVEMHFDGNAGVFERDVIDERVVDVILRVVFGLQQKGGRRVVGDGHIGIEGEL